MARSTFTWSSTRPLEVLAEQIVEAVAEAMVTHARRLAPVRTGRLKNSLVAERIGNAVWLVGTDVPYAAFVEFGTRRMRAQPYLGPSLEWARRQFR